MTSRGSPWGHYLLSKDDATPKCGRSSKVLSDALTSGFRTTVLLAAKGTQLSSNVMVANINEETYRYTMSVTPSQAQPGKSQLQLKVELTGDWEGCGWHSCKDESQAFMKRYSEKTGSVAVLASTK